jgi:hypothetical protein
MGAENRLRLQTRPAASGEGLLQLEAEGGVPALIAPGQPVAPGACLAHFRAEAAELHAATSLAGTTRGFLALSGEVGQVSFPGGFWRHVVATPAGSFVVDAPKAWPAGAKVNVHIPQTGLFVFPGGQG